ncbi:glutathione metabolism protein [Nitrincola sp. A-D6]|uniref:MAPEG family protein n=1 Tax=Nitrincola sp. A-D6 TaxID=1545442 RepID=UPI00051FA5E0|nr:MAPEG family protein [Nitrincola sp. A-D6]KGK41945.1 glutathione metabolism protein [Nitrincola sp. A-D6]
MSITPIYAALLALLFVFLSFRIIRLRRALQVGLGDAGDKQLGRAIRVHANFAEYVPLGLLLVFFVEAQQAPFWWVHVLGLLLLLGRLLHAYGVGQVNETLIFRMLGMIMTFASVVFAAIYLLVSVLF